MKILPLFLGLLALVDLASATPYEQLADDLTANQQGKPLRISVLNLTAKGPGSEKWADGLALVRSRLEEALGHKPGVSLIDRNNIDALEQEKAFVGKEFRIAETDALVRGFAMQVERKLTLNLVIIDVADGKQRTALAEIDPSSVGMNLAADLPPADASVRVANSVMFDIVRNLVKMDILSPLIRESEPDFVATLKRREATMKSELSQWSESVAQEVRELTRLDSEMVAQSLDDRIDYLRVEGQLQGVDTKRQQALIDSLRSVWKRAKESGIEPSPEVIIESCREVQAKEKAQPPK